MYIRTDRELGRAPAAPAIPSPAHLNRYSAQLPGGIPTPYPGPSGSKLRGLLADGQNASQAGGIAEAPVKHCCLPERPHLKDLPILPLFNLVVSTNIEVAKRIKIPADYKRRLLEYSVSNSQDGAVLLCGFLRCPCFFRGGWIMKLQREAGAMTLNNSVFIKAGKQLKIDTYVHEMVHVAQYKSLGILNFLVSYFGTSAFNILKRWLKGDPVDFMRSSPHENQAYQIECRFLEWLLANYPNYQDLQGRVTERRLENCV